MRKKFEYMVQSLETYDEAKSKAEATVALNEWGEMGWELVSILPIKQYNEEHSLFYFKRETK